MKFITVSELRQQATQIVSEIIKTKKEVVVTKNGKPVVVMEYITEDVFDIVDKKKKKGGEKR